MHKFSAWTHLSNFDQSEYKHWTKSVTNAWPWWENSKAGWMSRPRSVWNQNFKGAAHKHNIFHMNSKRKNLQPAIIWKLVTCQRITSKKMVDLDGLTPEPAIRTGDTGQQIPFLSIDHSTDVQYECNISFPVFPNSLESVRLKIGFPVVRRTRGLCRITWLPNFLGWVDLLTYGAPLPRVELRYYIFSLDNGIWNLVYYRYNF